jgi:hypothetical protein
MWGFIRDHIVSDIRSSWRWATTWLNVIGSAALTYALANEAVVNQLLPFLPDKLKPYAPAIGIAWGAFVQIARSVKQKIPTP